MQVTLSKNGEITIPLAIREQLGLVTGATFEVLKNGKDIILVPDKYQKNTDLRDKLFGKRTVTLDMLFGSLKSPHNKPVTLEEMDEAIEKSAVERYLRSFEHD